MKLKIPNWGSLCKPNLLMNSDYRSGIINQKGITSLDKSDGSTELGIDGWIQYGINCSVATGSITFANRTSVIHTVQQPLDIKDLKAGDKVTFYASCFNITGSVYIYLTGLDNQRKKLVNGDNEFTFTLTSSLEKLYILLAPNAVVSFNCMKLEPGEHFTGMPVWNEASELYNCLERYQAGLYGELDPYFQGENTTKFEIIVKFQRPMKKLPTISKYSGLRVGKENITPTSINVKYMTLSTVAIEVVTSKNYTLSNASIMGLELDGYTY